MRAPLPQASLSGYRTSHPARGINYAGPCGDNGFLEDYTTQVRGEPIGVIVTVSRDEQGLTREIVVNHRPRSSVLFFSRLMGEKFGGGHFVV